MSFSRLLPRSRFGSHNLRLLNNSRAFGQSHTRAQTTEAAEDDFDEESPVQRDFLPLKIKPDVEVRRQTREIVDSTPVPRSQKMDPDQDWTNVWPTGAPFRHSATPFPVRMGVAKNRVENDGVVPDKSINVELIKVSNFLHLTPRHVEKHCQVLQQFCTEWPEGLETEEDFDKHFPVEVTTQDFVYNWSLRDERSKVNEVKVKLSALHLNHHGRDKMVRLAEGRRMIAPDPAEEELKQTQIGIEGDTPMNLIKEKVMAKWNITHLNEKKVNADGVLKWRRRRMYGWWDKKKHWLHPEVHALQEDLPEKTPIADYDFETDKIVLTTQQCPTRQQNYDHAMFLIKALYGESMKRESWEDEKEVEDLERFIWEKSEQKDVALKLYRSSYPDASADKSDEELLATPEISAYREAVEELVNFGETEERLARYKSAVKKLMAV